MSKQRKLLLGVLLLVLAAGMGCGRTEQPAGVYGENTKTEEGTTTTPKPEGTEEPEPTETPEPTSTPTPMPTPTPEPTPTPKREKVLVAEEINPNVIPSGAVIPDLMYFCNDGLSFKERSFKNDETVQSYYSYGGKADYEIVKEYVEVLVNEYEFEYVDEPYYKSYKSAFFEFVLRYTGKEKLNGKKIGGTYTDNSGDIMIYGTIEGSRVKGAIYYNSGLTAYDDGKRYGTDATDMSLVGASAASGLYLMPDDSYTTADGRLSATLGEAMLLSGGNAKVYSARFVRDQDSGHQTVFVEDKYGTVLLEFYVPNGKILEAGQILNDREFMIGASYAVSDGGVFNKVPAYTWSYMFTALHDEKYHVPITAMQGDIKRLNVRVMYLEEDILAVFHVGVRFNSEPQEEEYLIAVPIGNHTTIAGQPDGEFTVYVGEQITIDGPKEYDTNYDLWEWEFIENGQIAELSGEVSRTVTVTGMKEGTARLRVKYDYGVDEADVLTGNTGYGFKSKTREYDIHVIAK